MGRALRERPRLALVLSLGALVLVGVGLLAGLALAGGDSGSEDGAALERAERVNARQARELRAQDWRRRAQRLATRNRALRRALALTDE